MEYIDGPSLKNYIDTHGCLSVKESLYYFLEMLKGVNELHSFKQKIIHRDLKPANIMLTKDLRNIKIIDFGISSVTDFNDDIITNEKIPWGTFPYLHPDILTKGLNAEAKTKLIGEQFDIYALGVILYEMLIGKYPFIGDYHKQEYIKLAQKYDFVSLNDIDNNIPPALENVIFRCLACKPEDAKFRYNNIQEIIDDINHIIANPTQASSVKLLKPKNKRVLQMPMAFNVENQKLKEKFYEKKWFYFTALAVAVVCVVVTIILAVNHEFL
jgi:serine/threonine-protein kinase